MTDPPIGTSTHMGSSDRLADKEMQAYLARGYTTCARIAVFVKEVVASRSSMLRPTCDRFSIDRRCGWRDSEQLS